MISNDNEQEVYDSIDYNDTDMGTGANFAVLGDMDIDLFGEDDGDESMLVSPGVPATTAVGSDTDDIIELGKPVVLNRSGSGFNSSDGEEEVLEGGVL